MQTKKQVYWVISGEGERGTWERVVTTARGIKLRLTRERCGGDRWARAYELPYVTIEGCIAGYDIDDGTPSTLPEEARADVVARIAEG